MAVGKKKVRPFSLGVKGQAVLESIAPAETDAVPALLKALQEHGGVDELIALLDKVESAAAEAGGVDQLRNGLETLKRMAA